jgi:hypothetical protein
MERICRTCLFFDQRAFQHRYTDTASGLGMGLCRRNPPVPDLARLATTASFLPRGQMIAFSLYPETCLDDWCGEWRAGAPSPAEAERWEVRETHLVAG